MCWSAHGVEADLMAVDSTASSDSVTEQSMANLHH